jgi:hypothetical protein
MSKNCFFRFHSSHGLIFERRREIHSYTIGHGRPVPGLTLELLGVELDADLCTVDVVVDGCVRLRFNVTQCYNESQLLLSASPAEYRALADALTDKKHRVYLVGTLVTEEESEYRFKEKLTIRGTATCKKSAQDSFFLRLV